jgi:hypothetical protein
MRRIILFLMISTMIVFGFGCESDGSEEQSSELPNPVRVSSYDEILATLGMTLKVPEDAENVVYQIIDIEEGPDIAEANFSLDQVECTYRVQSTSTPTDISGAYYDWTVTKEIEISYCSGEISYIEGQEGICLWYDTVPGLMYSVFVDKDASEEMLLEIANEVYIPAEDAN